VNEVRLRGRLAVEPEARALPSGDVVVACRLVVDRRPVRTSGPGSTVRVDTLDCAAFSADARRKLLRWGPGDIIEIEGSLRRRFFRAGGGAASRYEVEVRAVTRVMTAAEAARATMAG
jgi:single-strand DNA-binding protein